MFARKLAPDHDLILIARRKDRLERLADGLSRSHGSAVETIAADLTDEGDLARVESRIAGEERLCLLVNNAGFGTRGLFWEAPLEGERNMHALHVMATMRLCHAGLRAMVPRDRGGIINVASVAGFVRRPGSASYGSTKSWINVFTEGLYLDLGSIRSKVTVQALCPGFTFTEFHDTMKVRRERVASRGFWMTAEQVVDASLEGLRRGRLFVIPGWRYRLLCALITKLPSGLRLALEARSARVMGQRAR
jgi:short-subunit dehydrogenase